MVPDREERWNVQMFCGGRCGARRREMVVLVVLKWARGLLWGSRATKWALLSGPWKVRWGGGVGGAVWLLKSEERLGMFWDGKVEQAGRQVVWYG